MSKVTLGTVKYYDPADIYSYEVDNRPLYDISANVELINTAIANLGFYQEVSANPETEPPGGFTPLTCVLYGQNGLLFPIDISQPVTTIDYAKFPIFLVIEKMGVSKYKCLAFSSAFNMPGLFNKFLPDSIGRAIKLGPGGSLVDEIYFDLYYSDYTYQNIIVGKVLTPSTITFGGNQVAVLGDNRFLAKNRDDSTSGLIVKIIQNDINSSAFKSILTNTAGSPYPFTEYINQTYAPIGSTPGRLPVYFTSLPLSITDGIFNGNIDSLLNEVHFAAPSISASTHLDSKYKTAGVNVASLLGFSGSYLLHAKPLSINLSEVSQTLSTSLHFDSSTTPALSAIFDSSLVNFGTNAQNLASTLTAAVSTASGLQLGPLNAEGTGAFVYHVTNNAPSDAIYSDSDQYYFPMSGLSGGSAVVFTNKGAGAQAAMVFSTQGPLVLDSNVGVFCIDPGTKPSSLTNRNYVDKMFTAAANSANSRIPLAGSTADAPITGSLYFDVKSNNTDTATVLEFDSLIASRIKSSYPVEFKALATSDFQTVRGATPSTGEDSDLTTRLYVQGKIDAAITTAVGTNFVTKAGPDSISGTKTFESTAQIITSAATPLVLNAPIGLSVISLATTAATVVLEPSGVGLTAKFETSATVDADPDNTLVTKKYMLDSVEAIASGKVGAPIYAIWNAGTRTTTTSLAAANGWGYATRGITPDTASANFLTAFDLVESGALLYKLDAPLVLQVNVSDARIVGLGPAFPGGIFRTQTAIITKSGGTTTIVARNIHQDDTDGSSVNSLVGSSCSAVVLLNKNDILYILSEQADTVSASLARIS